MGRPAKDGELVQIVDAALADAARRAGPWLVCRVGCTQCCHGAFAINALDAERLRSGMDVLRAANPALVERIESRARTWVEEFGAEFPGDLVTGFLGETNEEQERFGSFAEDAACPALDPDTGSCDVYAWRPITCRVFGPPVRMDSADGAGLGHCELCFQGASEAEVAACEMAVPHALEAEVAAQLVEPRETVVALALLRK